jgi:BASS family bile acid:Na+ symporter
MQKINEFIEKYFALLLLLSAVIGIALPQPFISLKSSLPYLLGFVLFLSFLKIDFKELIANFKKIKLISWLIIMPMIILPIIIYLITSIFNQDIAIAFLIITAIPPAVAASAMTELFKGNVPISIIVTVLGHLIVPLTMPILLFLLLGKNISIPLDEIFIFLFKVAVAPFFLAVIIKNIAKKIIQKTQPYYKSISVITIFIITLVAIAINYQAIYENPYKIIVLIFIAIILAVLLHLFGWLISYKLDRPTKISSIILTAYNNMALGLLVAINFFSPQVILMCVAYEIVWTMLPVITKIILPKIH